MYLVRLVLLELLNYLLDGCPRVELVLFVLLLKRI